MEEKRVTSFYRDIINFRPNVFSVDVVVDFADQARGDNAVSTNDKPFVIEYITHQIIRPIDQTESVQIVQHGLYRINWSLYQQDRYWQGTPPMADAAFGSIRHGLWKKLRSPVPCEGNRTLDVEVQNAQLLGTPGSTYTVQVQFHGLEDWRDPDIIAKEMEYLREVNRRREQRS